MPLNNPAPQFALTSAFDLRGLSGQHIFTRGSTAVSLPTYSSSDIYEDVLFFSIIERVSQLFTVQVR